MTDDQLHSSLALSRRILHRMRKANETRTADYAARMDWASEGAEDGNMECGIFAECERDNCGVRGEIRARA